MGIIRDNDTVLFQGDSITDMGRLDTPDGLGLSYVAVIQGLLGLNPDAPHTHILNRGVGGDRTEELLARWETDCEDLHADVLSLMIGVNDVWRITGEWNGQTYIGPEEYEKNYRELLDRALTSGVRDLILCSPTTIENGKNPKLTNLLAERRDIVKQFATEYKAVYVPMQEYQAQLLKSRPDIMWTADGCHPTIVGHTALARCWLDTVRPCQ